MENLETKTVTLNYDLNEKYATMPVIQQIGDVISFNAKSSNDMNKIFSKTLDDLINVNKKILIRLEHLEEEYKEINYIIKKLGKDDNLYELICKNIPNEYSTDLAKTTENKPIKKAKKKNLKLILN